MSSIYEKLCPVCKNKFYTDNRYNEDFASHTDCLIQKKLQDKKRQRPVRTSTPVSDADHSPSSFSDSVTDFFYQSWKTGLHSDETFSLRAFNQWNHHPCMMPQTVCYAPQVYYVSTVIFQPYVPASYVGYRPDGTFGVLPNYWFYDTN